MKESSVNQTPFRRGFLRDIGTGAAALGLAALTSSFKLISPDQKSTVLKTLGGKDPADVWFDKVKGTHRGVFDSTEPNDIFPFVWPRIFLLTNAATGSPESDCGVVVVLRHESIGYAMKDKMWAKYNFAKTFNAGTLGPAFQAADAATATQTRNPF